MTAENRDFNKAAASWDEEPKRVKLAADIAKAITEEVTLTRDMDVLDFGCGTGLLSLNLQPSVHTVTCVDSAQGMLDVVHRKVEARGLSGVKTACLDIAKGDRLEGRYHLATSSMAFHHVKEIGPLLDQLFKVLAPAGHICIADLDLDDGQFHEDSTGVYHDGFDRAGLRQAFEKAGFADAHDRTAASMVKPIKGGGTREFTIFLLTGLKQ